MRFNNIFTLIFAIIFLLSSCDQNDAGLKASDQISYKIERKNLKEKPLKASFDIRIEEQISKSKIEEIANNIISEYPGFNGYFIFYWLPDMEIGNGAWATSHFIDNNLSVNIQGVSTEEENRMKAQSVPNGEIVGKWYDGRPYVESTIIIYQEKTTIKVRQIYKDGSFEDKSLKQNGKKYIYPNESQEFFKIEDDGNLGWYSKNGRFAIAKKL